MAYWSFSSCDENMPRSTFNEMKTMEQTEEHLAYERQKNHLLVLKSESLRNANQQFVSSYESLKLQMNELLQERTALFQKNVSIIYQNNRYKKELQTYREMLCKTTKRNRTLLDELIRNNNLLERFLSTSSLENDQFFLYDFDYISENCNQMKIENKGNEQNSSFRGRLRPGDPLLTPVQEEENYVSIVQETFVIDSLEKRFNNQMQNINTEGIVLSSPQGDSKFKGNENHCKNAVDELVNNKILNDHQNSVTTEGPVQELLPCGSSENLVTLKNVRDFFPPVEVHQQIVPFVETSRPFQSINSKNFEINSEEGPLIDCQSDNGRQEPSNVFPEHSDETIRNDSSAKTGKDKQKRKYAVRNISKNTKKRLSFESKDKRGRKRCMKNILKDEVETESIESNVKQDRDERGVVKSGSSNDIKYNTKECEEIGDIETRNTQILGNTNVKPTPTRCKKKGKMKLSKVYGIQTRSKTKVVTVGGNASNEVDANVLNDKANKSNAIRVNVTPCENKIALPCTRNKREIQSTGSNQQGPKAGVLNKRSRAKTESDALKKNKCPKQGNKNLPISTPKSNINSSDSMDFDEINISPINKLIVQIPDKNNPTLPINKQTTELYDDIIPAGPDTQKSNLDCKYTVLTDLLKAKTKNGLNTYDAQLNRILTSLGKNDKVVSGKSDIGSEKLDMKADSMKDDSGIQVKIDTSAEPINRTATDTIPL